MDDSTKQITDVITALGVDIKRLSRNPFALGPLPNIPLPARQPRSVEQANSEALQLSVRRHINEWQSRLAEDDQLVVLSTSGMAHIVVKDIGFPNWHTVILVGFDEEGNPASVLAAVNTLHLTCKIIKIVAPAKPYRVGFMLPEK